MQEDHGQIGIVHDKDNRNGKILLENDLEVYLKGEIISENSWG